MLRFQSEFAERVRALPGVTHVSAINMLPMANTGSNGPVRRVDQVDEREGVPIVEYRVVMDRYFETMAIPVLAGCAFDDARSTRAAPSLPS